MPLVKILHRFGLWQKPKYNDIPFHLSDLVHTPI